MSGDVLSEALRGVVAVTFTKRDGSTRIMRCTTNLALIPSNQHPAGSKPYTPNLHRVYDLDIAEWRSFRDDTVLKVEILEGS